MSGEAAQQGWNCSRRFLTIDVSAHCGLGVCLECGFLEWPVRRRRRMGNGISRNPSGHLIVDSAAGQALTGEAACVRWEQKLSDAGLRGVRVHCKMMTQKGVGGAAHPTRSMMMPTMIDGLRGVLQYTVVEEDIPGTVAIEVFRRNRER